MTTLFSVSFTSCIDTEVSPVVEAIYEGQADLLAAQAAVQNAEAALRASQATLNEAYAAVEQANAAYTLAEVEGLEIANEAAQQLVDQAQADLNLYLAELAFELQEAGAVVAAEYLTEYKGYLQEGKEALKKRNEKALQLAQAIYMRDNNLYEGYQETALQGMVDVAALQVEMKLAEVAALEAILDDPTSLPAQVTAWEERLEELIALKHDLSAAEDVKREEIDELLEGTDDNRQRFIDDYEGFVQDSTGWADEIADIEKNIEKWSDAISDYPAALEAATQGVEDAQQALADAVEALGAMVNNDGSDDPLTYHGTRYYTKDAGGKDDVDAEGEKYDPATNLQEEYVNARIDAADADSALGTMEADFLALTVTYNNAATALQEAINTYEGGTLAAQIVAAETAKSNAEEALGVAQDAYDLAEATFSADPTGSVDGDLAFADAPMGTIVDDLGTIGKHDDDLTSSKTYVEVTGWAKIPGNTEWTPSTLGSTKMTQAEVLLDMDAKIAAYAIDNSIPGSTAGVYLMDSRADFQLWEQNGDWTNGDNTSSGSANPGADDTEITYLVSVPTSEDIYSIIYLEVEADDTSVSNLYTFNVATNMLGSEAFENRDFDTDGYLESTDPQAGYDSTPDANGETSPVGDAYNDTLNAQAVLWNASQLLAVLQAQATDELKNIAELQAVYDYQKQLFDGGQEAVDLAVKAKEDADKAALKAKTAVDNAWIQIGGVDIDTADAGDTLYDVEDDAANPHVVYENEDGDDALTLSAELFNVTVELLDLEECDEECLQLKIDGAQHDIDLIQPKLDAVTIVLADMKAQYDMYMEVNIDGDLDADLEAQVVAIQYEMLQIRLEKILVIAERDNIQAILDNLNSKFDDNLADIRWKIEQLYDNDGWNSIAGAQEDLAAAEEALALFMANQSGWDEYIEVREAAVAEWQARYDSAMALAAKYKALMEAALAS
ncbi:hypothetical protein GCM10007963_01760 [Lutibacter litoralis]|nr:hypothetical protein GCM10007963_01760 [Lutibacter litoralis]